jgi:hypothetical protein
VYCHYCRMEKNVISMFGLMVSGQLLCKKLWQSYGICMQKLKKEESMMLWTV